MPQRETIIEHIIAESAPELAVVGERLCESVFDGSLLSRCKKRHGHEGATHCDPRTGAYWDEHGGVYINGF